MALRCWGGDATRTRKPGVLHAPPCGMSFSRLAVTQQNRLAGAQAFGQTRRNTPLGRMGKMTAVKLQRERALAERRREKQQRRSGPKETVVTDVSVEDADLAGIRLGPQPPHAWQQEE
jgi:hypothetical protein